jgi:hypothetical protein
MHLQSIPTKANPYLLHLTKGEPNLGWLWTVIITCLILWLGSFGLIATSFLEPRLNSVDEIVSLIALPLSILATAVLLVVFVFRGAKLTFAEGQSKQLAPLNVSPSTVLWSLVLGTIYRARYWLTWIAGGCPYFLWLICQWYWIWALPSDLRCFASLVGHVYCYSDGPMELNKRLELFWFMSLTLGILGLSFFSILCSIGFTVKSKNAVLSATGVLVFMLPIILGVVLLGATEGFLAADTAYGNLAVNALFVRMLPVGIAVVILPFVALLGAQRFLRQWAFK